MALASPKVRGPISFLRVITKVFFFLSELESCKNWNMMPYTLPANKEGDAVYTQQKYNRTWAGWTLIFVNLVVAV